MAKNIRFNTRSFRLVVAALTKERTDLAVVLLRAMHAELTLSPAAVEDGHERHLQHQRLAEQINARLATAGHEIVLDLFPRGASTEESLAEEFGRDLVIGYGPEALAADVYWGERNLRSYEDGFGSCTQTFFFYSGDASVRPGVYFRRLSNSGRHDYLVRIHWGQLAEFLDPEILRTSEEFRASFLQALDADLKDSELENEHRYDEEDAPKWEPAKPDPWQQWEEWEKSHPDEARQFRSPYITYEDELPAPAPRVPSDEDAYDGDLDDEEFLGESTLAKLRSGSLSFGYEDDEKTENE